MIELIRNIILVIYHTIIIWPANILHVPEIAIIIIEIIFLLFVTYLITKKFRRPKRRKQ